MAQKAIGQYRFQVEEFVPDRISVEIVPPKAPADTVGPGQMLGYQVQSSYLFGAPAAGLPVETRVRLVDSTFAPKGYEAFSFRNDDRKLDDNEVLMRGRQARRRGTGQLPGGDAGRRAGAVVARSRDHGAGAGAGRTRRGGAVAGAGASLSLLHRAARGRPRGIEREGFADPGKPAGFEYVAVSPDGKEVPSGGLRADLFEDRWNTVLRKTASGNWRYETTRDPVLIASKAIAGGAAGKGRGTFEMTPRRYGSYRVVLTDPETQASTQVEFYAAGWGTSPWAMKNPSRLELDLDKTEYASGDTAVVQVRAPFAGKLLLTVERDRVLDTQVHTLTGNTAKIELPVSRRVAAERLRHGHAGAGGGRPRAGLGRPRLRRRADLGEPHGEQAGAADRGAGRDAAEPRPDGGREDGAQFDRDGGRGGRGHPAAHRAEDARAVRVLLPQARPGGDLVRHLQPVAAGGCRNLTTGGDESAEGMGQYVRTEGIRRVEPVAFWSGPLEADGEGNVKVTFKVPEFQGALRVMAVAFDEDRFGSSHRLTRVRDPLVLLPTLPRILSFGETLQVPVTVRNDTGKTGAIQIGLTVQGPAQGPVTIEQPAVQTVEIPQGREKTVYFTVKTGDVAGNVRFVATASGNREQSKSTTNVGIRPDLPVVAVEDAGAVNQATLEIPAKEPERYRPETLRRTVRVGPLPLVQFAGKLDHLLHYPYGCIEQTTSSAFPLIYIGDIAKALDPGLFDPKKGHGDPAEMVQAGLSRIATMQLPSGGFAMWPGGQETHLWGSIYATHFLVEARKAGHPVPDSLHRNALGWVANEVKAKGTYGSDELQRMVYGLYVLARAGRPDLGTMDFIRQKHRRRWRRSRRPCSPPPTPRRAIRAPRRPWRPVPEQSRRSSGRRAATSTRPSATGRCCSSPCSTPIRRARASRNWWTGWPATLRPPTTGGRRRRRASLCSPSASSSSARRSSRPTPAPSSWAARRSASSPTRWWASRR